MNSSIDQILNGERVSEAKRIIDQLISHGFIAFLAGGCVRDALLGRRPKDYDVATNATPQSVREVFGASRTLAFGASFGVIGVLPPRQRTSESSPPGSVEPTEVATFRSDGQYSDGRRPDSVQYGTAEEDALRRDFTINGLFYDPIQQQIVDYVGGQADLSAKLLRTIGTAKLRFDEDKLRMLRAVRFATLLDFQIEAETFAQIQQHSSEISFVSAERIGAELRRILTSQNVLQGLELLDRSRLSQTVLPELERIDREKLSCLLSDQVAGESTHSLKTGLDFPVALAAIALCSESPEEFLAGVQLRWRLSTEESRRATSAITHYETVLNSNELPWSVAQPVVVDRDINEILMLAERVGESGSTMDGVRYVRSMMRQSPEELNPPMLITGDDLRIAGMKPGPHFRNILSDVRNAQLDQQVQSVEDAWELIRNRYPS